MAKEDFEISIDVFRKNWHFIILALILLIGLGFRYYHIDYPVIGYHNWKESRYLEEARHFSEEGFFNHGIFVAEYDYPNLNSDPSGAHAGEFPSLSILIGLFFMVLGPSLMVARIITLIIGLGIIAVMYFLVRELFEREDLALASAAAMAIMPLLVFFTHNVQVINLALLLMLLGAYFYVRWVKKNMGRDMILASVFVMLAGISKYEFLIIGIPMLFIFPWKRLKELKKYSSKWHSYIVSFLIFALVPVQYLYSTYITRKLESSGISSRLIHPGVLLTSQWWITLKAYTADNYTILGFVIALFGIGFFLLFYNRKNIGHRFMLGYLAGLVVFVFIMAQKLGGHSYHQYAIAPLFGFMIAYCLAVVATNINNIVKIKLLKPAVIILLFIILYFPSASAWNRQFDTQFFGLDIAGEYINSHAGLGDAVINSGFQDYGVLWYADRKSTGGEIPNSSTIKWAEENRNVQWIFLYQWGLQTTQDPDKWNYIKSNYRLVHAATINNNIFYMLFRKGGSFNESMLKNMTGRPGTKDYELTSGTVTLDYIDFE